MTSSTCAGRPVDRSGAYADAHLSLGRFGNVQLAHLGLDDDQRDQLRALLITLRDSHGAVHEAECAAPAPADDR